MSWGVFQGGSQLNSTRLLSLDTLSSEFLFFCAAATTVAGGIFRWRQICLSVCVCVLQKVFVWRPVVCCHGYGILRSVFLLVVVVDPGPRRPVRFCSLTEFLLENKQKQTTSEKTELRLCLHARSVQRRHAPPLRRLTSQQPDLSRSHAVQRNTERTGRGEPWDLTGVQVEKVCFPSVSLSHNLLAADQRICSGCFFSAKPPVFTSEISRSLVAELLLQTFPSQSVFRLCNPSVSLWL